MKNHLSWHRKELEITSVPCWDDGRDEMAVLQQEELGELPHILF